MWFDSRRSVVVARNGMVATSQPLAASTGLRVLMEGGNAIDACVTMAAVLGVVEPNSTGIGGDVFALVWMDQEKQIRALNGSGRAPAASSIDELRDQGHAHVPLFSPQSVTVPGTVHAWDTILRAYGTISLSDALQPAILYANGGFPVSDIISRQWEDAVPRLAQHLSGNELLVNGRAPRQGEVVVLSELAQSLRSIAEAGPDVFYKGDLAQRIASFIQNLGGWLTTDDLAAHTSTWHDPISTEYRGITCWQCPPNGSGIAVLMALNIAECFDLQSMGLQSPDAYHHLIEAMRLSYADTIRYVADPLRETVPIHQLLSKSYARDRASLIKKEKALSSVSFGQVVLGSDTVYLSAVDGQGNACSLINSVFEGFGTGLVVPGTGIALHNRGSLFSLDPAHPNALAPGKRPYHTLIPGMATRKGELWLSHGVMGAFQQPQGNLQVLVNMIDFGLDPQQALNALRFSIQLGGGIAVEEGLPRDIARQLSDRGHEITFVGGYQRPLFGGGQIIARDPDTGVLWGGSEPRKDGCAIGW